jgi:hypothetical protein
MQLTVSAPTLAFRAHRGPISIGWHVTAAGEYLVLILSASGSLVQWGNIPVVCQCQP